MMIKKKVLYTLLSYFIIVGTAFAVPYLQLDIIDDAGVKYDTSTETIVSKSSTFTLRAMVDDITDEIKNDNFYISMAVVPKQEKTSSALDLGSFAFSYENTAGQTIHDLYRVTGDMEFGAPVFERKLRESDEEHQESHGIFDTYFTEFEFQINDDGQVKTLEDGALTYVDFEIDVSDLADDNEIHFDFYSLSSSGTRFFYTDISRDAQSGHAPEPNTLLLLGFGLMAFAGISRRSEQT